LSHDNDDDDDDDTIQWLAKVAEWMRHAKMQLLPMLIGDVGINSGRTKIHRFNTDCGFVIAFLMFYLKLPRPTLTLLRASSAGSSLAGIVFGGACLSVNTKSQNYSIQVDVT